jgi:hypothetical protein
LILENGCFKTDFWVGIQIEKENYFNEKAFIFSFGIDDDRVGFFRGGLGEYDQWHVCCVQYACGR